MLKGEKNRLEANIHPDNKASIRVAEKSGFSNEGLKIGSGYNKFTNNYEDRVIMGLIN